MKLKIKIVYLLLPALVLLMGMNCTKENPNPKPNPQPNEPVKLKVPPDNGIYHGAFPDFGGTEDNVSAERMEAFETLAGKGLAWAYFSNNWSDQNSGIKFPTEEVRTIHNAGKVPFVRMMPRSNFDSGQADPTYTMEAFLAGDFDNDLKQWAIDAKHTGFPILVEFGTEVNGDWFPWNARYNGKDTKTAYGSPSLYDGMERFRDVYRKIIDICNQQGAKNITWFYHVNANDSPLTTWNTKSGYYPGDAYIDWIGVSVYGAQEPGEDWNEFATVLSWNWDKIRSISPSGKPIAILEWGVTEDGVHDKPQWITNAVDAIKEGGQFFPHIKAMSYWHENFDATKLRIDSSPASVEAYRQAFADDVFKAKAVFSQ